MRKCILFVSVNAQNLADKSIIVISSAHAADAGTYKCIARNQYENDTATTIVTITGEYYGNTFYQSGALLLSITHFCMVSYVTFVHFSLNIAMV